MQSLKNLSCDTIAAVSEAIDSKDSCEFKVYIYFYTDSVGFPRIREQRLDEAWPLVLKDLIEANFNAKVYPCIRGLGGATINEIAVIYERDKNYFKAQGERTLSFTIFNVGIVDAAPVPFTYPLRYLSGIPRIGPSIWSLIFKVIRPYRGTFQKIYSYRRTSPQKFKTLFEKMIKHSLNMGMIPISIDTPLMPGSFEKRSPGLLDSIGLYNTIKHSQDAVTHIEMDWVSAEHLTEDGHHFNKVGNKELGEKLFDVLSNMLNKQLLYKAENI